MAPTVVSPIETRVIGPIAASEVGRLKIPTPMMLPMISAIATGSPKPPRARRPRSPVGRGTVVGPAAVVVAGRGPADGGAVPGRRGRRAPPLQAGAWPPRRAAGA